MKWVKQTFAVRFNRRDRRSGHIWGDRYVSWVLEGGTAGRRGSGLRERCGVEGCTTEREKNQGQTLRKETGGKGTFFTGFSAFYALAARRTPHFRPARHINPYPRHITTKAPSRFVKS
jgi:hypothetical protein